MSALILPLTTVLDARARRAGPPDLTAKLWLPNALRQLLPLSAVRAVLSDAAVAAELPLNVAQPHLHWTAGVPLHLLFCN